MADQPEALRLADELELSSIYRIRCAAAAELRRLHARAEFAEQQMVELAEERDHYRRLLEKERQAEPVLPEYGSTDCVTFAGLPMTDGDKRLAAMLTQAFGTDHPAIHDLAALLFAARGKQQAEPVQFNPAEALRLAEEFAQMKQAHGCFCNADSRRLMEEAHSALASYLGIKGGGNG